MAPLVKMTIYDVIWYQGSIGEGHSYFTSFEITWTLDKFLNCADMCDIFLFKKTWLKLLACLVGKVGLTIISGILCYCVNYCEEIQALLNLRDKVGNEILS